jgi:hypothetical protein
MMCSHLLEQDLDETVFLRTFPRKRAALARILRELAMRLEAADLKVRVAAMVDQVVEVDQNRGESLIVVSQYCSSSCHH